MFEIFKLLGIVQIDTGQVDQRLQSVSGRLGAFAGVAGVAAGAAVAVGAALVGTAVSAFNFAQDLDTATKKATASLGLTAEEAKNLQETAKNVFANNFGKDIDDVVGGLTEVRNQVKGLAEKDLQAVTEGAFAIRDAFGVDIKDSAAAVNTLMKEFGLTSQEATDFVTSGFQKGLNASGDFLESINEYGVQFSNGGADAGQFFSTLQTGLKGGVLGTDKAADAFKEFRVRIQDGSKTTTEGLAALGINAKKLGEDMASGQVTAADAFQLVLGKLKDTKDGTTKMQAGVALLGTQYEDLGQKAVDSLSMSATRTEDLKGATATLNKQYETMPALLEGFKRQALVAFEPVGAELLKIANGAMPLVQEGFTWFKTYVPPIISSVIDVVRTFGRAWSGETKNISPPIRDAVNTIKPILLALGGFFTNTFTLIKALWERVLKPVFTVLGPYIGAIFKSVGVVITTVVNTVSGLFKALAALLRGDFSGAWKALQGVISGAAKGVLQIVNNMASGMQGALGNLAKIAKKAGLDFVAGLVSGMASSIKTAVAAANDMASQVSGTVKKFFKIKSPSKLMAEYGEYLSLGLAQGIAGKGKVAVDAATALSAAIGKASKAELEQAAARAKAVGDTRTLALITKELSQRQLESATALKSTTTAMKGTEATTKSTTAAIDKQKAAVNAQKDAVSSLNASIKFDEWKKSLDGYTDAQLKSLLTGAKVAGNAKQYNAIKAEQTSREKELAAAAKKSATEQQTAAKKTADAIKAIDAGNTYQKWAAGLKSFNDQQLNAAKASARAAGDQTKYNEVVNEQNRRIEEATQKSKAWQANLDKFKWDSWVNGLKNASSAQLKKALATASASKNVEVYNAILAEQERRLGITKTAQEKSAAALKTWTDNLDNEKQSAWVKSLDQMSATQLAAALAQAKATKNVEDYNAIRAAQIRLEDQATSKLQAWKDNLAGIPVKAYTDSIGQMNAAQLVQAEKVAISTKNTGDYNAVLARRNQLAEDAKKAQEAWNAVMKQEALDARIERLKKLSLAELESRLATAKSMKQTEEYTLLLGVIKTVTDDAAKKKEEWDKVVASNAAADHVKTLEAMTVAELEEALARAESTKNAEEYTTVLGVLGKKREEVEKTAEELAKNRAIYEEEHTQRSKQATLAALHEKLVKQTQYSNEWMATLKEVEGLQKEIDAEREKAAKKSKELADNKLTYDMQTGALSRDQHLQMLREKLAGEEQFSDEWMRLRNQIQSEEQAMAEQNRNMWMTIANGILDNLSAVADAIGGGAGQAIDFMVEAGNDAMNVIGAFSKGTVEGIVAAVSVAVKWVVRAFQSATDASRKAQEQMKGLKESLKLINAEKISVKVTTKAGGLKGFFGGTITYAQVSEVAAKIAGILDSGIGGAIGGGIKSYLQGASTEDVFKELGGALRNTLEDAIVESLIQGAVFKGAIGGLLEQLTMAMSSGNTAAAKDLIAQIGAQVPALVSTITEIATPLRDALDGAFGPGSKAAAPAEPAPTPPAPVPEPITKPTPVTPPPSGFPLIPGSMDPKITQIVEYMSGANKNSVAGVAATILPQKVVPPTAPTETSDLISKVKDLTEQVKVLAEKPTFNFAGAGFHSGFDKTTFMQDLVRMMGAANKGVG